MGRYPQSYFAILPRFHFLKVSLRIKILHKSTSHTFLNSGAQRNNLLLLLFQKTKSRADYLTGVVITASRDTRLYELLEMRS